MLVSKSSSVNEKQASVANEILGGADMKALTDVASRRQNCLPYNWECGAQVAYLAERLVQVYISKVNASKVNASNVKASYSFTPQDHERIAACVYNNVMQCAAENLTNYQNCRHYYTILFLSGLGVIDRERVVWALENVSILSSRGLGVSSDRPGLVRSFTAANWLALVASVDELGGWNNRGIQFANVDVSRKLASMTWINQSVAPTPVYTDPLTRTGPEQPITKTEFLAYIEQKRKRKSGHVSKYPSKHLASDRSKRQSDQNDNDDPILKRQRNDPKPIVQISETKEGRDNVDKKESASDSASDLFVASMQLQRPVSAGGSVSLGLPLAAASCPSLSTSVSIFCLSCRMLPREVRLNCGHSTFCRGCISKLFQSKEKMMGRVKCPVCFTAVKWKEISIVSFTDSKTLDLSLPFEFYPLINDVKIKQETHDDDSFSSAAAAAAAAGGGAAAAAAAAAGGGAVVLAPSKSAGKKAARNTFKSYRVSISNPIVTQTEETNVTVLKRLAAFFAGQQSFDRDTFESFPSTQVPGEMGVRVKKGKLGRKGQIIGEYVGKFSPLTASTTSGDKVFEFPLKSKKSGQADEWFTIDAEIGGNETSLINDYRVNISVLDDKRNDIKRCNCKFEVNLVNGVPKVLVLLTRPVKELEEVLIDYGKNYWLAKQASQPKQFPILVL